MAKATLMQTAFNAGEWSPLLGGHINLERWPSSCSLLQNLIALKQGPITRRGGFRFVKEVKDSSQTTVILPFQFNIEQEYIVEAGDEYFRFYTDNGVISETAKNITAATQANPVQITIASHGYSNGDEVFISSVGGMTELNNKFYLVASAATNTFTLQDTDGNAVDSSAFTAYTSGGTVQRTYEISSPYADTDLQDSNYINKFQHAQSADVLYIAHGDFKTRALARSGNTNWSLNNLTFNDGPYLSINDTTTTFGISSGVLTASSTTNVNNGSGFLSTDVGRSIRLNDGGTWLWGFIDVVNSTTSVDISGGTLGGHTASATTEWRLGLFSETTGYPKVVTFFQDRLFLAGCSSFPDRYAFTRTGGYSDTELFFAPSDDDGTVTDDAGFVGTLQSGQVNAIQWAGSDDKGLIIGTASKEFILRPSTSGEVLTPNNAKADSFSSIGSAYIQPVQAENGTIFMQFSRKKMQDIIYSFERDQLKPRDLTIFCEHITGSGASEIVFQQEPINNIWVRRTDGLLLGYTYYPDEAVFAASRHPVGGVDVKVRSMAVIPSADASRDELWCVVERTINGVTRKYIEYQEPYADSNTALSDVFHVDSGLTYSGSATDTITGLDHLEGETVKVLVDGKSHPDLTVSNGSVTLANNVSGEKIQIGLGFVWAFQSQRPEGGGKDGVSQGKTKRKTNIVIRLLNSLGLYYGPNGPDVGGDDEYDFNQGASYDEVLTLFSGDTEALPWPNGYEFDDRIYLWHDGLFPATVLSITQQLVTQDR